MKYIDADCLRAEIDKIEEEARTIRVSGTDKEAIGADSKVKLCLKLKSIIDSLQQEQPEMDLEKFIGDFIDKKDYENQGKWCEEDIIEAMKSSFNLGLNARKEENK